MQAYKIGKCGMCGHVDHNLHFPAIPIDGMYLDSRTYVVLEKLVLGPYEEDDYDSRATSSFETVHQCEKCGYCSNSLRAPTTETKPIIRKVMRRVGYKRQLNNPELSECANRFICRAMIEQELGKLSFAAWAMINAAWRCDDYDRYSQARECRIKAVELILKAEQRGQHLTNYSETNAAILIDVLRRTGEVQKAMCELDVRRPYVKCEKISRILDFEESLINGNDFNSHAIGEAFTQGDNFEYPFVRWGDYHEGSTMINPTQPISECVIVAEDVKVTKSFLDQFRGNAKLVIVKGKYYTL